MITWNCWMAMDWTRPTCGRKLIYVVLTPIQVSEINYSSFSMLIPIILVQYSESML